MATPLVPFSVNLLSFLIFFHIPMSSSKTNWADVQALKQLKLSVDPNSVSPGSCLSSWDFSIDPCDSLSGEKFTCGFTCSDTTNVSTLRVTDIALDQAGYSGSLSSTPWSNLQSLQSLDISNNNFSGPIPSSLSTLTRITRLTLSRNSFTGPIPDSLGQLVALEELYLDANGLTGAVPSTLNGLKNLKRLEVQENQLSGALPDLSGIRTLYLLDTSNNLISGGFQAVGLPASLVEIAMRNNRLQGVLPWNAVSALPYLQVMDLSHNQLSGQVPASLFTHPSLQQLVLSGNGFSSVGVPGGMGRHSELIAVDLSGNQLSGFLPNFLGLMPKLSAVNLEDNRFTGLIPLVYGLRMVVPEPGVAPLERLLLGRNYLFGPIPGQLMELKPGSVDVSLVGNCLMRCSSVFFFCQGGDQRPFDECRSFNPVIPMKG